MRDSNVWFIGTTTITLLVIIMTLWSNTDFKFELSLIFSLMWLFQNILVFMLATVFSKSTDKTGREE